MSEFRVIKCKKCSAALVELEGETVMSCIQCGYKFNVHTSKPQLSDIKIDDNKVENNKPTAEVSQLIKKLRSINSTEATEKLSAKKKPVWGTVIKWYVIIVFSMGVLSQCFSRM